jgi:hypothetical protein
VLRILIALGRLRTRERLRSIHKHANNWITEDDWMNVKYNKTKTEYSPLWLETWGLALHIQELSVRSRDPIAYLNSSECTWFWTFPWRIMRPPCCLCITTPITVLLNQLVDFMKFSREVMLLKVISTPNFNPVASTLPTWLRTCTRQPNCAC